TPEALACLKQYGWPGNVRELGNEMKRLAVIVKRAGVEATDLAEPIRRCSEPGPAAVGERSLADAVAALERRMIAAALEKCWFNQQQAARLLGLSRQGLLNKIKRYGIEMQPG